MRAPACGRTWWPTRRSSPPSTAAPRRGAPPERHQPRIKCCPLVCAALRPSVCTHWPGIDSPSMAGDRLARAHAPERCLGSRVCTLPPHRFLLSASASANRVEGAPIPAQRQRLGRFPGLLRLPSLRRRLPSWQRVGIEPGTLRFFQKCCFSNFLLPCCHLRRWRSGIRKWLKIELLTVCLVGSGASRSPTAKR